MGNLYYREKEFNLEVILSIITGVNFCNSFLDIFELFCFVFDDGTITTLGLGILKDDLRRHLLKIHPELGNIKVYEYNEEWVNEQKEKFGDTLRISNFGQKLKNKTK